MAASPATGMHREMCARWLHEAIISAGGRAAEGGGDRSKAKAAPHVPDVIHSTAVWRIRGSGACGLQARGTWKPVEVSVTGASAVDESIPFMHISPSTRPWWSSNKAAEISLAPSWLGVVAEALCAVVMPFIFIGVSSYLSGKMPGKVGSDSRLHPLAA